MRGRITASIRIIAFCTTAFSACGESLHLDTKLVPSPVTVNVLLPPSYADSNKTYPLMLLLHGGGGDNGFLNQVTPGIEDLWNKKAIPEMVIATPDANRSFYMDYKDGSQMWETFIVDELLPTLREKYRVANDKSLTFVSGVSMGGMGSLRLAFKHLDTFGVVVSFEPGIEPNFEWKDVELRDRFWRAPAIMEEKFGSPIDEAYWAANNPATIARDNADAVKSSGLRIYIEVGTEDAFGLDRGTDFLHRVLYDNGIKHEYRMVYGADHVGNTMPARLADGFMFLQRILSPVEPDPQVQNLRRMIQNWKRQAGLKLVD